jgi:predicted transcriptional regulator
LTVTNRVLRLSALVIRLSPPTESRFQELAAATRRAPDDLVEDAITGYLTELSQVRNTLDSRDEGIKSNRVQPIEGEEVFRELSQTGEHRRNS